MKTKVYILFALLTLFYTGSYATENAVRDYNDGPYIFIEEDSLITKWVANGQFNRLAHSKSEPLVFNQPNLPAVTIEPGQSWAEPASTTFDSNAPIAAISDIHGQHGVFVELLQAQKVIDNDLKWSFGNGNLVIVGDVMDRGDEVLESLWLIYNLEQQAEKDGGKVHFLLGNHELMVMNGRLDYLHKKYRYTSALLKKPYNFLFNKETLMGQWLANKNVILQIQDKLFVHGGLSQQAMTLGFGIDEINKIFKEQLYFKSASEIEASEALSTLYYEDGPLWYRGYAFPYSFNKKGIDSLQTALDLNHIIVGHTSLSNIKGLYGNKIILIDSSIKLGETGELLLYDDGFKIGKINGDTIPLVSEENKPVDRVSLFQELQDKDEVIILLSEKASDITKNFDRKDIATRGKLTIIADKEQTIFSAGFEPGGKSRRAICDNAPIKIDLNKEELSNFNYLPEYDKLKIVFQCNNYKAMAEGIRMERFIYDLHNIVTPYSHHAKIVLAKPADSKKPLDGLLLESREDLGLRVNIKELEVGTISTEVLDRQEYVRMVLFQYMIANTDWSARKMHNSKLYQRLDDGALITIPYDFDLAGIINNEYAEPSEKLPITRVTQRYFMDKRIDTKELGAAIAYYLSIEKDIMALCDRVDYMGDPSKQRAKVFIEKFFEIIKDSKSVAAMLRKK